jgi:hypothetical protein
MTKSLSARIAAPSESPSILKTAWTTGYSGNESAHTPTLDAFRKEATSLPNTFVNSPVCSPSRASLLTSRYPTEVGILYDLKKDPEETRDLYENPEFKEVRERLGEEMKERMLEIGDPLFMDVEYPYSKGKKKER